VPSATRSIALSIRPGHSAARLSKETNWFVYHRKLSTDPGWADREIHCEPFTWDARGYPLVSDRNPADLQLGPEPCATLSVSVSGFASATELLS
jgi:hypothetical protein